MDYNSEKKATSFNSSISSLFEEEQSNQNNNENQNINDITFILQKINMYLSNKNYRSILRLIQANEKYIVKTNFNYFVILIIKLKCSYKFAERKLVEIIPGNHSFQYNPKRRESIILEKIFSKIKFNLQNAVEFIKSIKNLEPEFKEKFIQVFCEGLYLQAKFSLIKNQPHDSISYLSLAHSLLKRFIVDFHEVDTLTIYENILLLISSLLIYDEDYHTAIEYIRNGLKICSIDLKLRKKSDEGIELITLQNNKNKNQIKTLENITISLFQMGICFESLGRFLEGIEGYKQTRSLSIKLLPNYNPKFVDLSKEVEKLAFKYYDENKNFFIEKEKLRKKKEQEHNMTKKEKKKNKKLNEISLGIRHDSNKYKPLTTYIESTICKSPQPQTINSIVSEKEIKTEKTKYIMSNILMYDDLLSKDYFPYLYTTNNLNLNSYDEDATIRLDHYNNKLLSRQKFNQSLSKRRNNSNIENKYFLTEASAKTQQNKITSKPKHKDILNRPIERYEVKNKQYKTKEFKNKKNFIEKMYAKEIVFQKELLNLKRAGGIERIRAYEDTINNDKHDIKKDAEILYNRLTVKVQDEIKKKEKKVPLKEENNKLNKLQDLKNKLKNTAIISLNPRNLEKIEVIQRKKNEITFTKKYLYLNNQMTQEQLFKQMLNNVDKMNNKYLGTLTNDIQIVENAEKYLKMKKNK